MLSLAKQLALASKTPVTQKKTWTRNTAAASHMKHEKAVEYWRSKLSGAGWLSTRQLESKLGLRENSSVKFKQKLVRLGLLDRRNFGGEHYKPSLGFEYKWVDK